MRVVEAFREALIDALLAAQSAGALPAGEPAAFQVEMPEQRAHGDLATNLAMVLAKPLKRAPRDIAEFLIQYFPPDRLPILRFDVAGPGFLNATLRPEWLQNVLLEVRAAGADFGRSNDGAGQRVLLEFVSANPTGPLNVVSARAAALGDALARVLSFAGYEVLTEYYVNDAGNQILKLGQSLAARLRELSGQEGVLPEGGYPGTYVKEYAETLWASERDALQELLADGPSGERRLGELLAAHLLHQAQEDLAAYGVHFDSYFSEKSLHVAGKVERLIANLKERQVTEVREGALWLNTSAFGDDKDRVLVKSDGEKTYFAADLAYHQEKYSRGYRILIDVVGPDHHGHVLRMRAALAALGHDPLSLEPVIVQFIRLLRGQEAVKMSKRGGAFVGLRELLDEVGKDGMRFFFLMRSSDSPLDFDMDLAVQESQENPVFYVQYAHARIFSLLRQQTRPDVSLHPERLQEPEENHVLRVLDRFPREVQLSAKERQPHRLTHYLRELASAFHGFYHQHRVWTEDQELTVARLELCEAVATVLRVGLDLIGVSAPEHM